MNFAKLQATGNDFILVDARRMSRDWPKLAQSMCRRHFGIGADGLILVMSSSKADLEMRTLNSDGSEAEVCGNGLRCFAKYVIDNGFISGPYFKVSTLAGLRKVQAFMSEGKVNRARVNMGTPRFKAKDIPVNFADKENDHDELDIISIIDYPLKVAGRDLILSLVSMGNPHAVTFSPEPVVNFPLTAIGREVENHNIFPERVNFEVARVLARDRIEVRVWERGATETLSCGSGACAVAAIARLKGYTGDKVDIMLSGGVLTVEWDGEGEINLTGPVEEVFTGDWPEM